MKKVISLVLIFAFSVSLVITQTSNVTAQDSTGTASTSDDISTLQTVEEVQQALNDAREKLSSAGVSLKLLQKIKQLEARLIELATNGNSAKPAKCNSLIKQAIDRTTAAMQQITKRICSSTGERVDVTFYPMEKHCKSPFDTKCVCGHHPDGPGCGGSSMSGMSGDGMAMASESSCLSAEEAQLAIADLQRARENLLKLQELDADVDSVPDLCEQQQ